MRIAPVIPVRDVRVALAHYEALGFSAESYQEIDEQGPVYGFLNRDSVEIHLRRVAELDPKANTSTCYLYVDDADALHAEWSSAKVAGEIEPPHDTEYGLREFVHRDSDGNVWLVGSELTRE